MIIVLLIESDPELDFDIGIVIGVNDGSQLNIIKINGFFHVWSASLPFHLTKFRKIRSHE